MSVSMDNLPSQAHLFYQERSEELGMARFSRIAAALVVPAVIAVAAGCSSGGASSGTGSGTGATTLVTDGQAVRSRICVRLSATLDQAKSSAHRRLKRANRSRKTAHGMALISLMWARISSTECTRRTKSSWVKYLHRCEPKGSRTVH